MKHRRVEKVLATTVCIIILAFFHSTITQEHAAATTTTTMMERSLARRAEGRLRPPAFEAGVHARRLLHVSPSARVEIKNGQRGPVNHLELDPYEDRFLLVAAGDATVGLYDMEAMERVPQDDDDGGSTGPLRVRSLQVTPRASVRMAGGAGDNTSNTAAGVAASTALVARGPPPAEGHRHSVTSVQWYPLDTGLFVSGSTDGTVRVWDTNVFANAGVFDLGSNVHALAMSPAMRTHSLVAVGTDDRRVRLCDLKSGGSSHLLTGHAEAVTTVAWSPTQEHVLATGSRDSTVRLWDVRRSGTSACLMTLDQHADHRGRAPGMMGGPTELAKAHDGWVVSVEFTPNGCYLLSAGTDKRLRLWNALTGNNTLLNYAGTNNDKAVGWKVKAIQTGSKGGDEPGGGGGTMILYPNGASGEVLLYPLLPQSRHHRRRRGTGTAGLVGWPVHCLRGHLDAVQSIVYRRDAEQIITGGADSLLLVFDCSRHDAQEGQRLDEGEGQGQRKDGIGRKRTAAAAVDDWSSDEEEGDGGGGEGGGGGHGRGGFVPPILQQLVEDGSGRGAPRRREC